jgi:hypothetical protein
MLIDLFLYFGDASFDPRLSLLSPISLLFLIGALSTHLCASLLDECGDCGCPHH